MKRIFRSRGRAARFMANASCRADTRPGARRRDFIISRERRSLFTLMVSSPRVEPIERTAARRHSREQARHHWLMLRWPSAAFLSFRPVGGTAVLYQCICFSHQPQPMTAHLTRFQAGRVDHLARRSTRTGRGEFRPIRRGLSLLTPTQPLHDAELRRRYASPPALPARQDFGRQNRLRLPAVASTHRDATGVITPMRAHMREWADYAAIRVISPAEASARRRRAANASAHFICAQRLFEND